MPDAEFEKLRERNDLPAPIKKADEWMNKGLSKKIQEVQEPQGECEIKLDSSVRKFGRDLGTLVVEVFYKLSNCEGLCKDIEFHLMKVSEYYQELSIQTQSITDKYNDIISSCSNPTFQPVHDMYKAMTDSFREQAKIVGEEVKSFSRNIKMMFDFGVKEVEGLEDVHPR